MKKGLPVQGRHAAGHQRRSLDVSARWNGWCQGLACVVGATIRAILITDEAPKAPAVLAEAAASPTGLLRLPGGTAGVSAELQRR